MTGVCSVSGGAVIISSVDRGGDTGSALAGLTADNLTDSMVTDHLSSPSQHHMSPSQHNLRYSLLRFCQ